MNQQLLQSWLTLQCQAMPGARSACARIGSEQVGPRQFNASWPGGETIGNELTELLEMADRSGGPVTCAPVETAQSASPVLRIAHPINNKGKRLGAIAVELTQVPRDQQAAVVRLIEWGNTWLDLLFRQDTESAERAEPLPEAIASILQSDSLQQAGMSLTGFLARRYGCERVSLGFGKNTGVRLLAMSDSVLVPPRSELSRQLSGAMTEALAQNRSLHWPAPEQSTVPAHVALAEAEKDSAILTLILEHAGAAFAALTLESQNEALADAETQKQLTELARHLGPLLALKQAAEMPLRSIRRRAAGRAAVSGHAGKRIKAVVAGGLLASGLYFMSADAPHRISGPAQIEGEMQRALIAPFDGYIANAHARAGETVQAGFIIAELDDRELKLEQRQLSGDKIELEKQYRKALAGLDHAEARILKAQIAQAEARIDLLGQKLGRTQLRAPFSGVIVSGDLSRSLGKPVKRGEVLMEIAPLSSYRVAIEIEDRDISAIEEDQRGTLILAARPGEALNLQVINITRMPTAGTGAGSFRVEARLSGAIERLRPGMRGVAKLETGARSRFWIWTHEISDWLSYRLWAWLP